VLDFLPGGYPVERGKQEWVQDDGDDGAGKDEVAAGLWQKLQIDAEIGEDEGEFTDLRQ
jgi:hypothetical protein